MEYKLSFMKATKFRGSTVPKYAQDPISAFPCIKHCDISDCVLSMLLLLRMIMEMSDFNASRTLLSPSSRSPTELLLPRFTC